MPNIEVIGTTSENPCGGSCGDKCPCKEKYIKGTKTPIVYKPPKPKLSTKCCRCGRTYRELKKLGIGLDEMKDVIGGDDWNWWCDDCYIQMVGQECEICKDISTQTVRCPKCNTILCSTCARGHNCGRFGWKRIKKFFKEMLEANGRLYEYSPWAWNQKWF